LACLACRIRPYEPFKGPLVYWPPVPFGSESEDSTASPLDRPPSGWREALVDLGVDPEGDW
jgi:hypothetical protein